MILNPTTANALIVTIRRGCRRWRDQHPGRPVHGYFTIGKSGGGAVQGLLCTFTNVTVA